MIFAFVFRQDSWRQTSKPLFRVAAKRAPWPTLSLEEKRRGIREPLMSLSPDRLVAEAERLVARAERAVRRHAAAQNEQALRAKRKLQRLLLYRAVLTSAQATSALMPEYVAARGLVRGTDQPVFRRPENSSTRVPPAADLE
jgi:hypothetical protein